MPIIGNKPCLHPTNGSTVVPIGFQIWLGFGLGLVGLEWFQPRVTFSIRMGNPFGVLAEILMGPFWGMIM